MTGFGGDIKKAGLACLAAASILAFSLKSLASEYFSLDYPPTSRWVNFYSQNSDTDPNDTIGAFVDSNDPNTRKICVGVSDPDLPSGSCLIPVYGDDPYTLEKDGAFDGDKISFLIFRGSERELYCGKTDPNDVIYNSSDEWMYVNIQSIGPEGVFPYGLDDLLLFTDNWLAQDCNELNNYCEGCDKLIDGKRDRRVDSSDFAYLAGRWDPNKVEEWWYGE